MAEHFSKAGYLVNASTRSFARLRELAEKSIQPFIVNIDNPENDIAKFLNARILIINITSKNQDSFINLISKIEQSTIEKVLFISSTSVYSNLNKIVSEDEEAELEQSALFKIENQFRENPHFSTTIVRLSGLIGDSRHPGYFFRQGRLVPQPDTPVNLIHRDDCIGIIKAVIAQKCWGVVLNGCADTHPTKKEFYTHARKLVNLPAPEFAMNSNSEFKIVSNAKVKQLLNYRFIYPDVMDIRFD